MAEEIRDVSDVTGAMTGIKVTASCKAMIALLMADVNENGLRWFIIQASRML